MWVDAFLESNDVTILIHQFLNQSQSTRDNEHAQHEILSQNKCTDYNYEICSLQRIAQYNNDRVGATIHGILPTIDCAQPGSSRTQPINCIFILIVNGCNNTSEAETAAGKRELANRNGENGTTIDTRSQLDQQDLRRIWYIKSMQG